MSVSSTSGLNLSGLSGYDFSSIIDVMVQSYKLPENQMNDKITNLTTKKSAWQDINTRLSAVITALDVLKSSQTWQATTATTPATNSYFSVTGSGSGVQGTYTVNVTQIAQSETDVSKELTDSSLETALNTALGANYSDDGTTSNWDFTLTVNGETKTVHVIKSDSTKTAPTLQDVVNSINRTNAGVSANLVQTSTGNYRIAFNASKTGEANSVTFGDPNSFLQTIGVLNESGTVSDYTTAGLSDSTLGGKIQKAQDAVLTVNGLSVTSATNTVSTAIPGASLTLNAVGQSTVTVGADLSVAKKAVQDFISAYNKAQDQIESYMSYDSDTKKAGALLGDQTLQSIQTSLRQKVGAIITGPGNYKMLSEIGISTSGKSADLTLDESKFSNAFATDPQSVANLFSASYLGSTPVEAPYNTDELGNSAPIHDGLANFLKSYLNPLTKYGGTLALTTSSLDNQIKDLNDRISALEKRAATYEENLKLKFASLEATLTGLNSQSSWLNTQITALTSSSSSS